MSIGTVSHNEPWGKNTPAFLHGSTASRYIGAFVTVGLGGEGGVALSVRASTSM